MTVKRWVWEIFHDCWEDEGRAVDAKKVRYVLASDYDALALEVQGKDASIEILDKNVATLTARVAAWERRWIDENERAAALEARCAELEVKLNKASQVVGLIEAVYYLRGWDSQTGDMLDKVSAIMTELGFVPYRNDRELEQMVAAFMDAEMSGQRDLGLSLADSGSPK
jgi:hypothetical protein